MYRLFSKLKNVTGVLDNSGIEFFYTSTPYQHDAGIMSVGHGVVREMIIPPNTASYYIVGECSAECTSRVRDSPLASNTYIHQLCDYWIFL